MVPYELEIERALCIPISGLSLIILFQGVLSHAVCWDVLEKQLTTNQQYKDILRQDQEFQSMLQSHYIKNGLVDSDNRKLESEEESRLSQIYSSFTSLFSNVHIGQYFDLRGKKIGPIAMEFDFLKYLYSVPQLYNSTTKYLNFDYLKELVWPYDSESKEPSEETIAYMTAIMDQATHLSHYNKPHEDSPIVYVVAEHDRYIPRECYHVTPQDIYGGKQTEVRPLDTGHVLAIIQHHDEFRKAIKDAFVKLGCTF